jgi:hypothetical protein
MDEPRFTAGFILQSPMVLGLAAGLKSLSALALLHSFGFVMLPSIVWVSVLALSVKRWFFWHFLLAYSATKLLSGFFSQGEYSITYSLFALCFTLLLRASRKFNERLALLLAAVSLLASYEAMSFLGVALMIVVIANMRESLRVSFSPRDLVYNSALLLIFFASAALSIGSILNPRDPANLQSATNIMGVLPSGSVLYVALVALLAIAAFGLRTPWIQVFLSMGIIIASLLFVVSPGLWLTPGQNLGMRVLSGFAILIILVYVWIRDTGLPKPQLRSSKMTPVSTLSIFLALSVPQFMNNVGWVEWVSEYKAVSSSLREWVPVDSTPLIHSDSYRYEWAWTNPAMSLIYRDEGLGGVLNREGTTFNPWSPNSGMGDPTADFR